MNTVQKVGVFAGTALETVALFLHAPWSGYDTTNKAYRIAGTLVVPENDKKPFWEWYSNGTLIPWLGSMEYFLICVAMIAALTGFWVYLFRSEGSQR